jgi:hypothetical protein
MWRGGFLTTTIASGCCFGLAYAGYISVPAMRESPVDAYNHSKNHRSILNITQIEEFKKKGIVIIDNVLTSNELIDIRKELNFSIDNVNKFAANDHNNEAVRNDVLMWVSETIGPAQIQNESDAMMVALRIIRSIPYELECNGMEARNLGVPLTNQLSCYNGGKSKYIAHRDKPERSGFQHPLSWLLSPGMDEREITIILYLNNTTWDSNANGTTHNGNLKVYLDSSSSETLSTKSNNVNGESVPSDENVMYIEPIGGRVVIFESSLLHEVCPTIDRRFAITCWAGGNHSINEWLRVFCINPTNVNWKQVIYSYFS